MEVLTILIWLVAVHRKGYIGDLHKLSNCKLAKH